MRPLPAIAVPVGIKVAARGESVYKSLQHVREVGGTSVTIGGCASTEVCEWLQSAAVSSPSCSMRVGGGRRRPPMLHHRLAPCRPRRRGGRSSSSRRRCRRKSWLWRLTLTTQSLRISSGAPRGSRPRPCWPRPERTGAPPCSARGHGKSCEYHLNRQWMWVPLHERFRD